MRHLQCFIRLPLFLIFNAEFANIECGKQVLSAKAEESNAVTLLFSAEFANIDCGNLDAVAEKSNLLPKAEESNAVTLILSAEFTGVECLSKVLSASFGNFGNIVALFGYRFRLSQCIIREVTSLLFSATA